MIIEIFKKTASCITFSKKRKVGGEHNIHQQLKNNQKGTKQWYSRFGCCCVTETEPAAVSYHFPLYTGETKLAASDVASFHTGHRWIHLSTRNSQRDLPNHHLIVIFINNTSSSSKHSLWGPRFPLSRLLTVRCARWKALPVRWSRTNKPEDTRDFRHHCVVAIETGLLCC